MEKWKQEWNSSDFGKDYGDLFFKRATGQAPEMESSKAAALKVAEFLKADDKLCDVGCGVGHYYYSLKRKIDVPFTYQGVDATEYYVESAKKAFADDEASSFVQGDIFDIPFEDKSFDATMCNNVILHLPRADKPLLELCRITKKHLLIRTLVSEKSYVIQDVLPHEDGIDFDENNEPAGFHYLNIYSKKYIQHCLKDIARIKNISFELDTNFIKENIKDTQDLLPKAWDATGIIGNMQVSGMILQPWTWVHIEFNDE